MTVQSNAVSVSFGKNKSAEVKGNRTKSSNSTLDSTTKQSVLGQAETTKAPVTKPKSTTEAIKVVETASEQNVDEGSSSIENEIEPDSKSAEAVEPAETKDISLSEEVETASNVEAEKDESSSPDPDPETSGEKEVSSEEIGDRASSVTPKYKLTSVMAPFPTSLPLKDSEESGFFFVSSTPRGLGMGIKKIPTRLIAASSTKIKLKHKFVTTTSTKRPTPVKKVKVKPTKKPFKVTKAPKPRKTTPKKIKYERDPHHPHGVVVFDKRKKRPRPSRRTTTVPTTTTTTTSTTTELPTPELEVDYYDYYLSSGENSIEIVAKNASNGNSSRIPLSKLALAMLASSADFDNGTDDPLYYPKTPVNLLNILQAYTKQLQVASTETFKPPIKIQSQPFMVHLNRLNFATKVGISVYYSLIAIIPLVYLAFGGLGRLGFQAFVGRNLAVGRRRRRRRRSFNEDQYYYGGGEGYGSNFSKGHFHANTIKRIRLKEQEKEDEYSWILGRISEVIWEFSQLSTDMDKGSI